MERLPDNFDFSPRYPETHGEKAELYYRLSNLCIYLAGGSTELADDLGLWEGEVPPYSVVIDGLRRYGIPLAEAVWSDLARVYTGSEPVHFIGEGVAAERYRSARGVEKPRGDRRELVSVSDVVPRALEQFDADLAEVDEHGVSLRLYRLGVACRREQLHFYASDEWKACAKAARVLAGFRCQNCGAKDTVLEAHHITPIYSAFSKRLHRNFDLISLRVLCTKCHGTIHARSVKDSTHFHVAEPAEVLESKRLAGRREVLHDKLRECEWCRRFVWGDGLLPSPAPVSRVDPDLPF